MKTEEVEMDYFYVYIYIVNAHAPNGINAVIILKAHFNINSRGKE